MADAFVTVLIYCHWEDTAPIGVFESNRKAVEHIRQNYGDIPDLEYITEDDGEFYCTPQNWRQGQLMIQRFALNTARVVGSPDQ